MINDLNDHKDSYVSTEMDQQLSHESMRLESKYQTNAKRINIEKIRSKIATLENQLKNFSTKKRKQFTEIFD